MSSHLSGSYEELGTQAQQYLKNNQYDKAKTIYERVYNRLSKMKDSIIDRRPRLKELKLTSIRMLGDLASFDGDYDEAIRYYQTGLALDPEQQLIYQRAIAQIKIDKGDVQTGLDELRVLAVSNAGQSDPWIWLGLELWAQKNNAEAIENLERAAKMSGGDTQSQSTAYSYLHDLYREGNRLTEAEEAWQKAWQVTDSEMIDVSPLYQMYWDAEDMEQAHKWLEKEKNPLRSGFYRGLFAQAKEGEKRAVAHWRKTASLNPLEHQDGHEAWAEAALRINLAPDRVAMALREISGRNMINIRGTVLLAIAFARLGQADAAETAIKGAIEINQRARPRRDLLSLEHWGLFDELVTDQALKTKFRIYFDET